MPTKSGCACKIGKFKYDDASCLCAFSHSAEPFCFFLHFFFFLVPLFVSIFLLLFSFFFFNNIITIIIITIIIIYLFFLFETIVLFCYFLSWPLQLHHGPHEFQLLLLPKWRSLPFHHLSFHPIPPLNVVSRFCSTFLLCVDQRHTRCQFRLVPDFLGSVVPYSTGFVAPKQHYSPTGAVGTIRPGGTVAVTDSVLVRSP